jgi:hypothetical protein
MTRRGARGGNVTARWFRTTDGVEETFSVEASVSPRVPAKLNPPDEAHPAEGGEVEIQVVYRLDDDGRRLRAVPLESFSADDLGSMHRALEGAEVEDDDGADD